MPSQRKDFEDVVLGCFLIEPSDSINSLEESDFCHPINREVFKVIQEAYVKKEPVDMLIVSSKLRSKNSLTEILAMQEKVKTTANVGHYINLLKDIVSKEKLLVLSSEITQKVNSNVNLSTIREFLINFNSNLFKRFILQNLPFIRACF